MLRTIMLATSAALALTGAACRAELSVEAGEADHADRAVGGRRIDRPGEPGRRGRDREGARPEGRGRQSGRRVGLDRHAQRHAAPADGYTWTAGAAKDLGTYVISGLLDTKITDWRLYLNVINVSILGVNNNTPYKTAQDVVNAMKAKPGQVSVATAGINSSGHAAIEAFTRALGLTYKHVSYDGGNPAVIATVAGETEVTTQLAVEQANMIRGNRLRALAVLSDKPLELEGYGTIPPITVAGRRLQARRQLFRHLRAEESPGAGPANPRHGLEGRGHEIRGAEEICNRQRRTCSRRPMVMRRRQSW